MLVVPLTLLSMLIVALFGAVVSAGWNLGTAAQGALVVALAAAAGWLAIGAVALALLRGERRIDYLAHLAVTAFVGALVLLPVAAVGWWLPRQANLVAASLSVLASFALMYGMQRRRVAAVGLSPQWLWAWAAAISIGFVGTKLVLFGAGVLP